MGMGEAEMKEKLVGSSWLENAQSYLPTRGELVLYEAETQEWLFFRQPVAIWQADKLAEVVPAFTQLDHYLQQGYTIAGFCSYEAAPAFDSALVVQSDSNFPLAWFGAYQQVQRLKQLPASNHLLELSWQAELSEREYRQAIRRIKRHIAQGDSYQVNFTFRLRANGSNLEPFALFCALVQPSPPPYAAFLETEQWAICSLSPELFFRVEGQTVISRPMKGTAPRAKTAVEDAQKGKWLRHSAKNQAENVMITDMVRHDMGKIAQIGTVHVPALFTLEPYPTVWQMTSTVQCQTTAHFSQLFAALFPPASITGAPKARTMQLIAALEQSPRHLYTGTIGYMTPQRLGQWNVAIRTLLVNKNAGTLEYGIGSGIVWDSQPGAEFQECLTKAQAITQPHPPFALLETMRWSPEEGYFLWDLHLERLQQSAAELGFRLELPAVQEQLQAQARRFPLVSHRVRLLLEKDGQISIEAHPLHSPWPLLRVAVADRPIFANDWSLRHKTTCRHLYDNALQAQPEYDDLILWNERGELTEFCRGNLVLKIEGEWVTPAVESGLLAGTFRQHLLQQKIIRQQTLRLTDLAYAQELFLINSVRLWQPASNYSIPQLLSTK